MTAGVTQPLEAALPAAAPLAAVVLNAGSGVGKGAEAAERVAQRFRDAGWQTTILVTERSEQMTAAVQAAVREHAAAVVAGGGDGTVSAVAALLAEGQTPLGILPLGTLNHLARDLGIPLELDRAIDTILAGHATAIDAGEVNGRFFLNNASLGMYPQIVRLRQRYAARGWRKWLVAVWVTLRVLARHRSMAIRLNVGDDVILRRTPIVFIGNNEYRAAGLAAGSRTSLSDGLLAIYIVNAGGRRHPLRLIRLAWHMVLGIALEGDYLELLRTTEATVESRGSSLYVALDGEVDRFAVPLEFRLHPLALRVFTPQPPAEPAEVTDRENR